MSSHVEVGDNLFSSLGLDKAEWLEDIRKGSCSLKSFLGVAGEGIDEKESGKFEEGLNSKVKLSLYRTFGTIVGFKKYLRGVGDAGTRLLFKFRSGTHGLNEELGRHRGREFEEGLKIISIYIRTSTMHPLVTRTTEGLSSLETRERRRHRSALPTSYLRLSRRHVSVRDIPRKNSVSCRSRKILPPGLPCHMHVPPPCDYSEEAGQHGCLYWVALVVVALPLVEPGRLASSQGAPFYVDHMIRRMCSRAP